MLTALTILGRAWAVIAIGGTAYVAAVETWRAVDRRRHQRPRPWIDEDLW